MKSSHGRGKSRGVMRLTFGDTHFWNYELGSSVKTKVKEEGGRDAKTGKHPIIWERLQAEATASLLDSRRGWNVLSTDHLISSRFNLAPHTSGQAAGRAAYRGAPSRKNGPRPSPLEQGGRGRPSGGERGAAGARLRLELQRVRNP